MGFSATYCNSTLCITSSQPEAITEIEAIDLGPRMQCSVCQWIYDPAVGEPIQNVQPNTPWSEVPDSFLCPECSLGKDVFDALAKEAK